MVAKKSAAKKTNHDDDDIAEDVNLAKFLSTRAVLKGFTFWIQGESPLIAHAWSAKAKMAMLQTHVKAVKGAGKEARKPDQEFTDSLYTMDSGNYGFPASAVKKCLLTAAHKDKGLARELVMRSMWLHCNFVKTQPAFAGARCDLPLIRIYGSEPEIREDMVRIGSGLRRTSNLAYRAQFSVWALRVVGKYNSAVLNEEALEYLINESGLANGIGDWRNEKGGFFGSFRLCDPEECELWERFRAANGPLPQISYLEAAE